MERELNQRLCKDQQPNCITFFAVIFIGIYFSTLWAIRYCRLIEGNYKDPLPSRSIALFSLKVIP